MKPTSAIGQQLLGGVHEPEPGAQHRHDDRLRRPAAAPAASVSGVSTVPSTVGSALVASASSSVPMRSRFWRNSAFGVSRSRIAGQRVGDERVVDEVT